MLFANVMKWACYYVYKLNGEIKRVSNNIHVDVQRKKPKREMYFQKDRKKIVRVCVRTLYYIKRYGYTKCTRRGYISSCIIDLSAKPNLL